ncbi:MAG: glycoside hydrolase family 6 protein [Marinagarivorans sp.]|nr:glycoside hydrolase family 6 protein [Marinagarivorans sp.]
MKPLSNSFKTLGVGALALAITACTGGGSSSSATGNNSSVATVSSITTASSVAPVSSSSMAAVSSVVPASSSMAATSSSVAADQAAIDIVDESKYDGTIDLTATKAEGTPNAALQTSGNPFKDSYFYLSPDIKTMMDKSLEYVGTSDAALVNKIKFVQRQPSAIWMDSTATIAGDPEAGRRSLIGHLDAAVAQQNYFKSIDGAIAPMTVVIIVYNLPDRDCAAFASGGLLYQIGKPKDPQPNGNGLQRYRDEYIKKITDAFTAKPEFKNLRIVALLEPDSYPNMITNTKLNPDGPSLIWPELTRPNGTTYCDTLLEYTEPGLAPGLGVYGRGLQIAVEELYKAGTKNGQNNVYTYFDIAHAGWLGWDNSMSNTTNLKRGVEGFLKLIEGAGDDYEADGFKKVRGFASNTSGYTPVAEPAISNKEADRMVLADFYEWNFAVDEMTYIDMFNARVKSQKPSFNPGFIIDTARNGWGAAGRPTIATATRGTDASKRVDKRAHRGHWCNVNNAGIGESPKASPDASRAHLDAFFWMKPPGEADGISFDASKYPKGSAAYNQLDAIDRAIVDSASDPKYIGKTIDTMCTPGGIRDGKKTVNVVPALSPHAGGWFHKQFLMLIKNAHPALGTSEYD